MRWTSGVHPRATDTATAVRRPSAAGLQLSTKSAAPLNIDSNCAAGIGRPNR